MLWSEEESDKSRDEDNKKEKSMEEKESDKSVGLRGVLRGAPHADIVRFSVKAQVELEGFEPIEVVPRGECSPRTHSVRSSFSNTVRWC